MPKIIFNVRYRDTEYSDKSNTSKQNKTQLKKMYEYYNRDEACDKTINTEDAFDYYDYRLGSEGGFTEGYKSIDAEGAYKLAELYKPKSIYQTVLSFDKEFAISNNIIEKKNMQRLVTKSMEGILHQFDMKPDNVVWTAFYHTNTEHPHCHISFYEKCPTKKTMRIGKNKINRIVSEVVSEMEINLNLFIKKDKSINDLIDSIKSIGLGKDIEENLIDTFNHSMIKDKSITDIAKKLIELDDILPKEGSFKYNSKNIRPYHNQIKEVINEIYNLDAVKPFYNEYISILDETKSIQLELYGDGETKYLDEDGNEVQGVGDSIENIEKYYNNQLYVVETRIANMILQTILNGRKDYEVACENYKDKLDESQKQNIIQINEKQKEQTVKKKTISRRIPRKSIKKKIYKKRASLLAHGSMHEMNRAIQDGYYANVHQKQAIQQATRVAQAEIYARELEL